MTRTEINGHPVPPARPLAPAVFNYGHFTAMQVRGGRVRGLDLHLDRLSAATRELFGGELDTGQVRSHIRHALTAEEDASVRVYVVGAPEGRPDIVVTVAEPGAADARPWVLTSAVYQRYLPHIKHAAGFPQAHLRAVAARAGFDEVLLVAPDGTVSEGAISNFGLFDGTSVVWPDAPMLRGTAMGLVEAGLRRRGVPWVSRRVRLSHLSEYAAAFTANSRGIAAVERVGDVVFDSAADILKTVTECHDENPWDRV
ncbi:aminotransferase class IV [Sinosporangium siamense]|uniref:Branched-chain amino acid aminotransferase/4-amino-4-deoxychorismate lyase n=1 Tax=Sinosporangium siamense TaxID=1367973 RepID=A0A919RKR3_9ACTN|nr:aminotransferase class IV [Sinosporangium siamense]GII93714.1 hypothetical protein Ssi02_39450 [Sinosporangium siamense]